MLHIATGTLLLQSISFAELQHNSHNLPGVLFCMIRGFIAETADDDKNKDSFW
jgi:hypothetical protein